MRDTRKNDEKEEKEKEKEKEEEKEEEEEAASKNHPGSTTSLFGSSLEIPLVDSALAAKYATFPFMVMKFLSAILLAPGLHHTCLLGIIIDSAWSEASRPSKGFAPEQTRIVVCLLACLPLIHPSIHP